MISIYYGLFELTSGLFAYIVVMWENGFEVSDLINIRSRWYTQSINDLEDSYGQEWVNTNSNGEKLKN